MTDAATTIHEELMELRGEVAEFTARIETRLEDLYRRALREQTERDVRAALEKEKQGQ